MPGMRPDSKESLEILLLEMNLIQGIFNKYDDLIFRNRNWFITIWAGSIGLAFSVKNPDVLLLSIVASFLYWVTEGLMRYKYWFKYVVRYRAIRKWLNDSKEENISCYDLTNHFGRRAGFCERAYNSFLKLEPTVLSLFLAGGGVAAYYFIP